jgi:conjugal transfer pilus assembly protein TraF
MTGMSNLIPHAFLIFLHGFSLLASFKALATEQPFYSDKARGWFWREVYPSPLLAPETPEDTPIIPAPEAKTSEVLKLEPPPLSTAWFRSELGAFRDRAIDDPSPENLHHYFVLQRILMDKAHRFSEMAHEVVLSDPLLDENRRRPLSTFGVHEANRSAREATDEALSIIALRGGLLFAFRSDCRYCDLEAPLIKGLELRHQIKILPLSLDGKPLPSGLYPSFRAHHGEADALGITTTPALFFIEPPNRIMPIAEGLVALEDLIQRLLIMAHREGYLSDDLWTKTQGEQPVAAPSPLDALRAHHPMSP